MAMSGDTALTLARKYVKKTMAGLGAIKGQDGFSPTIKATETEVGQIVTIEDKNGIENFVILDGEDGLSVASMTIDANKHLISTMSDGSTIDAGGIPVESYDDTEIKNTIAELPTKDYVSEEIANAQFGGGDGSTVDLSSYATKEYVEEALKDVDVDLTGYATETFVGEKIAEIKIPSTDGLVSEEKLSNTLSEYAKTEELPNGYDDTELSNRIDVIEDDYLTSADKTIVDTELNSTSTNPVQNKVVNAALSEKVPTSRKINGKALSSDIVLSAIDVGAAESGHTHKYAASSAVGGSASSAVRLNVSSVGSVINPVYFKDGVPVGTTYSLRASVPYDAKFTDTTYDNFVKSGGGAKAGLVPAPPTTAGATKFLCEDGNWAVPSGSGGGSGFTVETAPTISAINTNDTIASQSIKKYGNFVVCNVVLNLNHTNNGSHPIFALPEGFRPATTLYSTLTELGSGQSKNVTHGLQIMANGMAIVLPYQTSGTIEFSNVTVGINLVFNV